MLQTRTSGRTAPALMRLSWRCPFRPQTAEKNSETKRHSRADYAVLPLMALSGFVLRIHYIHGSGIVVE